MNKHALVIGTGITGMTTALLLAHHLPQWRITLLGEQALSEITDMRTLVLLQPNYQHLLNAHLLTHAQCATNIHSVNFCAHGITVPIQLHQQPIVIHAKDLHNSLVERIHAQTNLTFTAAPITHLCTHNSSVHYQNDTQQNADLICVCTGSGELATFAKRQQYTDYHSKAWVFRYQTHNPEAHTASIDITNEGHMALLPPVIGDATDNKQATGIMTRSDAFTESHLRDILHTALAAKNASLFGVYAHYPLFRHVHVPLIENNTVILGNAAHLMHPIGAQGFNTTLRTLRILVPMLVQHTQVANALAAYQTAALPDIVRTLERTHLLATAYKHTALRTPLVAITALAKRFAPQASNIISQLMHCE